MPRATRNRSIVRGVAITGGALVAAPAAFVALAGRLAPGWIEALCSPWTVHCAVVLLAAALALAVLRARRLAVVAALLAAWPAAVALPILVTGQRSSAPASLRVVSMNVLVGTQPSEQALAWLASIDADVVAIVECSTPWSDALAAMLDGDAPRWPHAIVAPDDDGAGGIAIFSRHPLQDATAALAPGAAFQHASATLQHPDGPIRVWAVHPMPPVSPRATAVRNAELAWLADTVAAAPMPTIVLGDLNETPFGAAWSRFMTASGLQDARRGSGWVPTWPTRLKGVPMPAWIGIPIDHCLVSVRIAVDAFSAGPDIGSDHRPIVVDLAPTW